MILSKRKFFLLVFYLFLAPTLLFGQDAHFSQFFANPLYMNPAFAGTRNCPRFSINFRDQWPAIPKSYITFSGSYDQHVNILHGGVGLLVSADIAGGGIQQTYNAGLIYNFRLLVTHKFNLQFALQANYFSSVFNWRNLTFASDMILDIPEDLPTDYLYSVKSQFDANFGLLGYTPYLYFGFALHHLLPVELSFFTNPSYKIGMKWTGHLGGKITIKQKMRDSESFGDVYLYPNMIFISQGKYNYLHEGFYFNFYPLTIGAWLRHNFKNLDALIFACGIEYKLLRIGYSYDFNLNKLDRTGGSHEVSLQFIIPCKNEQVHNSPQRRSNRISPVACPNF